MYPTGKGFLIWRINQCEKGNPIAIADTAQAAGLSHLCIKVSDGSDRYNVVNGVDLCIPLVDELRKRGIKVWGWHYVYAYSPLAEADQAIQRVNELQLDGYIIDAEGEYKRPGKDVAARQFMSRLRSNLPDYPIAICSYRYPRIHRDFPWQEFLSQCNLNMPQVYWVKSHNPGEQLKTCVEQFHSLQHRRPIFPVGAAYSEHGWKPSIGEVVKFMETAVDVGLEGFDFYSWDWCRNKAPDMWRAIAEFPWGNTNPPPPPPADLRDQYISALNTRDVETLVNLYRDDAFHITSARTIRGKDAIRAWYNLLFTEIAPNAKFQMLNKTDSGQSLHFSWNAELQSGRRLNGMDSFRKSGDLIYYHYSFFSAG
ncbi:MAG TPA: nuclear transport factor 2 family protein [Anaerolineaceae bacterium]|nr:nuclear transport factor 2 family protein [Anaerolineaceae bacterium]HOD44671.1 nuclear transport factor 2 family protein [Anaerolineaceae bacterium]